MPFTLLACGFIMYFGQYVFSTFNVGFLLICFGAAVGGSVLIHNRKDLRKFFSSGFLMVLLISLAVVLYDNNRSYSDFDEFWHWGTMVKESLRLDRFYSVPASRLIIHKDYPPFLCMMEILFVKLSGSYSEGITTMGLHIFMLSVLLCPVSEKISDAFSGKNKILQIAVSVFLPLVFTAFMINLFDMKRIAGTLVADAPLALIFAYAMLLILSGEVWKSKFDAACFMLSVCAVIMIKQAGLALAMLLVLAAVLMGVAERKSPKNIGSVAGAAVLFSVLCYFSWSVFVKQCNINDLRQSTAGAGQFDFAKIDAGELLNILSGKAEGLRAETAQRFIRALIERNITAFSVKWFSFAFCFLITSAMIVGLFIVKLIDKRKLTAMVIVNIAGFFGYAFMLLLSFLFCFTSDEMMELRGYERYTMGFILGIFLAYSIWAVLLYLKTGRRWKYGWVIALVFCYPLLLHNMFNLTCFSPQQFRSNIYQGVRKMGEEISSKAEDDSVVIMVYNPDRFWFDGYLQSIAYHYANNCDLPWNLNIYSKNFEEDTIQKIAAENMSHADYIYIVDTNDSMNTYFKEKNNGEDLVPLTLYRIEGETIERCE